MGVREKRRKALEILSKGAVAFHHTWKPREVEQTWRRRGAGRVPRSQPKTVEVFEFNGKYARRDAKEVLGPFSSLNEALLESELLDDLDEAGELIAYNSCTGTGGMCGDGETRIYKIGGMYLINDDWGGLDEWGPFPTLDEAAGKCGLFYASPYSNDIFCMELSADEITERLSQDEDEPFGLSINGEDWEWDGKEFRRDVYEIPKLDPAWLTWNDGLVVRLAQAADQAQPNSRLDAVLLAVLADALEEAGCDNCDILTHLRSPAPHVRGCWVVDLLLGKRRAKPRPGGWRRDA
jgi:hypothetical protein